MIRTAVYTDIGGREVNEDSVKITRQKRAVCAVVADGLGGHGGGELASSAAAELICGGWDGSVSPEKLCELANGAHKKVQSMQTPECAMKTTVVALTVKGRNAAWCHAGDSRLYRFHNGRLAFQTLDHSVSQMAVVLGDITPEQIRFHSDRNKVLRALGQEGEVTAETGRCSLLWGKESFLLCTDGFWEYVLESEMEEDLIASKTPEEWLEKMARRIREKAPKTRDNCTAAAVWVR